MSPSLAEAIRNLAASIGPYLVVAVGCWALVRLATSPLGQALAARLRPPADRAELFAVETLDDLTRRVAELEDEIAFLERAAGSDRALDEPRLDRGTTGAPVEGRYPTPV